MQQRMVRDATSTSHPPMSGEKVIAHKAGAIWLPAALLVRLGQAIRRLGLVTGLRGPHPRSRRSQPARLVAEGLSPADAARAANRRTAERRFPL